MRIPSQRTAAGELYDAHARTECASRFGALNHRERHSVLVRAGGVVELELHEHIGSASRHDSAQSNERRAADCVEHRAGNRSHRHVFIVP